MKKPLWRNALIFIGIAVLFTIIVVTTQGRGNDALFITGLVFFLIALVYLVVGVIMSLIQSVRAAGQALLLAAGILMLVGLSICGTQSISWH